MPLQAQPTQIWLLGILAFVSLPPVTSLLSAFSVLNPGRMGENGNVVLGVSIMGLGITAGLTAVVIGRVTDRKGTRPAILAGLFVVTLASAAIAFSDNRVELLVLSAPIWIAGSVSYALIQARIVVSREGVSAARAMAILVFLVSLGVALTPTILWPGLIFGHFFSFFGDTSTALARLMQSETAFWRIPFALKAGGAVLALLLAFTFLKNDRTREPRSDPENPTHLLTHREFWGYALISSGVYFTTINTVPLAVGSVGPGFWGPAIVVASAAGYALGAGMSAVLISERNLRQIVIIGSGLLCLGTMTTIGTSLAGQKDGVLLAVVFVSITGGIVFPIALSAALELRRHAPGVTAGVLLLITSVLVLIISPFKILIGEVLGNAYVQVDAGVAATLVLIGLALAKNHLRLQP